MPLALTDLRARKVCCRMDLKCAWAMYFGPSVHLDSCNNRYKMSKDDFISHLCVFKCYYGAKVIAGPPTVSLRPQYGAEKRPKPAWLDPKSPVQGLRDPKHVCLEPVYSITHI